MHIFIDKVHYFNIKCSLNTTNKYKHQNVDNIQAYVNKVRKKFLVEFSCHLSDINILSIDEVRKKAFSQFCCPGFRTVTSRVSHIK